MSEGDARHRGPPPTRRIGGLWLSATWPLLLLPVLSITGCGGADVPSDPENGISRALAEHRAASIDAVVYDLAFTIPEDAEAPIEGSARIRFELDDVSAPLVLDFAPGGARLRHVALNGATSSYRAVNGHIVLPAEGLDTGHNVVDIEFVAGDGPLNRHADFLYTLFVPARAHEAYPCFDQPDLKARFTLELDLPAAWRAVANGADVSRAVDADRQRVRFAETGPIPTYLFAFAAGRFEVVTAQRGNRVYHLYHRETDLQKVERNTADVFDLHSASLEWLERYTRIGYPFGKLDFVLIPSFQYNGMEHPGAIFYRAESVLLEASATQDQLLRRASVIAHETAHMWFGNLVTMRWFDDVWLKEVFANFMADKIVRPSYPDVNHELGFLVAHFPRAYAVDRTAGTHPIRQPLENLADAGSLYGRIIYDKAPIVMRQLEQLLGAEPFRRGLGAYLERFAFDNATWRQLIAVLSEHSETDLVEWSRAWVEEAGRPRIRSEVERDVEGRVARIALVQSDDVPDRDLIWAQQTDVVLGAANESRRILASFDSKRIELGEPEIGESKVVGAFDFVLPGGTGLAYGAFELDRESREALLAALPELGDPLVRAAAWIALWEAALEQTVSAQRFVELALRALPRESVEQNVQLVLDYLERAFWIYLSPAERAAIAGRLEGVLRSQLSLAPQSSLKATYFRALRSLVTTPEGTELLRAVWRRERTIEGLSLAISDEADIALELAVRSVPDAQAILEAQLERFDNPDARARFEFLIPALSPLPATREAFFASLADVENRGRELWVSDGLRYLNHPLRAPASEQYLQRGLELLPEIQRTGDIFFPSAWLEGLLAGHRSANAAATVRAYLAEHEDLPARLRRIVLQEADDLFRAASLR